MVLAPIAAASGVLRAGALVATFGVSDAAQLEVLAGEPTDRQRRVDRLLHQKQRAPHQRVVQQGDIDRRKHGEEQHLRHRQHAETAVKAQVSHAKLQRPGQPQPAHQLPRQAPPAGQGDKHQRRNGHPHQHCKITIHPPGKVLTDKTERKGPKQIDDDQVRHWQEFPARQARIISPPGDEVEVEQSGR